VNDNEPTSGGLSLGPELAALLEHRHELLFVLDHEGRLAWLSAAAARWMGEAVEGTPIAELVHPSDAGDLLASVAAAGDRPAAIVEVRSRVRDRDGSWRTLEISIADRRRREEMGGLVCVAKDVTERSDMTARLIHQATHDTLTALPNRASLIDRLNDADVAADASGSVALLYIDLDGFKGVNDSLGHAAGDRVLVTVADRLRRAVRPGDTVARLGGDEFVVVADGVTDGAVTLEIGQRIISSICRPVAVGGRLVSVSASIGATIGRRNRAMEMLEEADRAMYRAKEDGRNRCTLFTRDMRSPDDHRVRTEELLRSALDRDGVAVLYQPVVDLATGRVAGVDATLRLRSADGSLRMPAGFLDVAEETGLSVAVGAGLLDLACGQAAIWNTDLGDDTPPLLSVPVSARQLADRHAAERVVATLDAHGIAPGALCLDLPEATLVDADSTVTRSLQKLKSLGVRLAIDDFGSGRSSLAYLRRYAIDVLRIDRGFMTGLGHDEGDTEVVRAVVGLGEALGMTTLAKGVETADQAAVLRDLGCQLAQGFHFGRPVLPEDAAFGRLGA
jgi:diguanylate cyclase (GGDEF)-like protein/PAS domain S-box-containing protein